jgi:hypothetical protein
MAEKRVRSYVSSKPYVVKRMFQQQPLINSEITSRKLRSVCGTEILLKDNFITRLVKYCRTGKHKAAKTHEQS